MSLIAELKRRKVFKVGAAYLVVAWLAVQAASIGFPAFDAPPWALRVFILVSLLGFPLAVVMAWIFDSTPEGMKLDPSPVGGRRVFAAAAVLVALALGWYFYGQPSFRKGDVATPVAAQPNSIAVLPFTNMSSNPEQEFFSDGMTEELLNVLAKVPQLKVVARTSVFEFKGKGGDVREIGRKLGVSHILEGSVRRDGDQVRVTAQLVRVSDGFHLWSESYDRKLEGVFALQDEIARQISEELKQSLGVATQIATRTPVDPAAYDEYLKGRSTYRKRKDLPASIAHLKSAVARAPEFGAGWASLSLAYEVAYWTTTANERVALGDIPALQAAAAQRAASLEPGAAMTLHALGNLSRSQGQLVEAERFYLQAMQADATYPDVREDYAELLAGVGRHADAYVAARALVSLEPYVMIFWWRVEHLGQLMGRRDLVDEAAGKIATIDPGNALAASSYQWELAQGNGAAAVAAMAEAQRAWPGTMKEDVLGISWATNAAGVDDEAARAMIRENVSYVLYAALRPDADLFFDAYADEQARMVGYSLFADLSVPVSQHLLEDPRAKEGLIRHGLVAYWREKGWPPLCRPLGNDDFECKPAQRRN